MPRPPFVHPPAASLCIVCGLLAAAALSPLCPAEPPAQSSPAAAPSTPFPATTAGRIAAAYLAMFNSNSDEAVANFERTYRSSARRNEVGVEERQTRVRAMRTELESLSVKEIVDSSDDSLSIQLLSGNGQLVGMRFNLDKKEPGKLDGVEVMVGGPMIRSEPVSQAEIAHTVDAVCDVLDKNYVDPEVARKMSAAVRENLTGGAYSQIATDHALARRLTDDLRSISKDRHLDVNVLPPEDRNGSNHEEPQPAPLELAKDNYGFRKVELLPGNVGYIKFDFFAGVDEAHPTVAAAMTFVGHCHALVFDLRQNGGGSPEMVRFIISYLFVVPTHLNDMVDRDGKTAEEFWTLKDVPGPRIPADVPVYVLTSSRTFSGAEEFAYDLKSLKRATIVGETTGGGGHAVRPETIGNRFVLNVPFMRASNPITKTNWEGVGVEPDVKTTAGEALDRALKMARENGARTKPSQK